MSILNREDFCEDSDKAYEETQVPIGQGSYMYSPIEHVDILQLL